FFKLFLFPEQSLEFTADMADDLMFIYKMAGTCISSVPAVVAANICCPAAAFAGIHRAPAAAAEYDAAEYVPLPTLHLPASGPSQPQFLDPVEHFPGYQRFMGALRDDPSALGKAPGLFAFETHLFADSLYGIAYIYAGTQYTSDGYPVPAFIPGGAVPLFLQVFGYGGISH